MAKRRADFDDTHIQPSSRRFRTEEPEPFEIDTSRYHEGQTHRYKIWFALKKVLDPMSPVELFGAARQNSLYEQAAKEVYGAKYKHLSVYFKLSAPEDVFQPRANVISVLSRDMCMGFILIFQELITSLRIDYELAPNVTDFNVKLAKYCAMSLRSFSIIGTPIGPIRFDSDKPFLNVTTLKIENSNLAGLLMEIPESFPFVFELSLNHVTSTDFRVNFKEMKRLYLGDRFTIDLYAPFLAANPQLAAITITTENIIPLSRIMTLLEENLEIEMLKVTATSGTQNVTNEEVNDLTVNYPTLRVLRLENYMFRWREIEDIMRMPDLDVFYCMASDWSTKNIIESASKLESQRIESGNHYWRNLLATKDPYDMNMNMRLTRQRAH